MKAFLATITFALVLGSTGCAFLEQVVGPAPVVVNEETGEVEEKTLVEEITEAAITAGVDHVTEDLKDGDIDPENYSKEALGIAGGSLALIILGIFGRRIMRSRKEKK
jgi:hypothetical protein